MPRAHDRSHFFKYLTGDTAKLVLQNRKLKWSAPTQFNDPFDHQTALIFQFGSDEFQERFVTSLEEIVFGPAEPEFEEISMAGKLFLLLRRNGRAQDREEVLARIRAGAADSSAKIPEYEQNINGLLADQLTNSRVLCLSEVHDNVVMWSHYADEHRGAVLKLNCVDEIDDNFLAARPVQYVEEFTKFPTAEEWVNHLLGIRLIDYGQLFFDAAYLKHQDWAYEKEWRIHIPILDGSEPKDGVSYYEKDGRVFGALYLGCRMSDDEKQELLAIVAQHHPRMAVFEMVKAKDGFWLEEQRVR
jgi:predicted Fe-S protein YdhL (DUF1289 family)